MNLPPHTNPKAIRRAVLSERANTPPATVEQLSKEIEYRLTSMECYKRARHKLFYVSFKNEVNTHNIIKSQLEQDGCVAVPKTDISNRALIIYQINTWEDLAPGAYGILEPKGQCKQIEPSKIDLVLVPGSVFDRRGGRYGYGGGFYDKFLAEEAPQAIRIGLAFSFQLKDRIPIEPHDQLMDIIVTDREILRISSKAVRS